MSLRDQAPLDPHRLLRHDASRLIRQWTRLQRVSPDRKQADLERWAAVLDSAYARFQTRLEVPYRIEYSVVSRMSMSKASSAFMSWVAPSVLT